VAVEILRGKPPSPSADAVLLAMRSALIEAGEKVVETRQYKGGSEWLVLFGVGAAAHSVARDRHVAGGGKALLWDLGYWGRRKKVGYFKATLNSDHPQHLLDKAPANPSRWNRFGISLRNDFDKDGPIILVGLGRKSRDYLGHDWEARAFADVRGRFPDRRVIYRPKTFTDELKLPCERNDSSPIEDLLRGASLVVCRHSNVGVDAVIAGVPVETEDGAAVWLKGREDRRLEFLQRLAWFQWKPTEAAEAWVFMKGIA